MSDEQTKQKRARRIEAHVLMRGHQRRQADYQRRRTTEDLAALAATAESYRRSAAAERSLDDHYPDTRPVHSQMASHCEAEAQRYEDEIRRSA